MHSDTLLHVSHSHAAQTKPVLVLPGLNHANVSNGRVNNVRGDIPTSQTLREGVMAVASMVIAFIAANWGEGQVAVQAVEELVAQQRATMERMGPLAVACGFGDVKAAHDAAVGTPPGPWLPGGIIPGSAGVENTVGDAAYEMPDVL